MRAEDVERSSCEDTPIPASTPIRVAAREAQPPRQGSAYRLPPEEFAGSVARQPDGLQIH